MKFLVAIGTLAVLTAGCGTVTRPAAGAQPASSTRAGSAAPSASPTPGTRLTIRGALTADVSGAGVAGPCGRAAGGGLGAELRFPIAQRPWALAISLPGYTAPGAYPLPPSRLSLHTLGIGSDALFFGSLRGTVVVAAGDVSGTIDADLVGDSGTVHVNGAWSCAG